MDRNGSSECYDESMLDPVTMMLVRAHECLAGAESEFANGRHNNCANRAYYACFQAAIAALAREGIRPAGEQWGHEAVPSSFDGVLINRRKLYPPDLRGMLDRNRVFRLRADYFTQPVTEVEASRALRRARSFVTAIQQHGGRTQ